MKLFPSPMSFAERKFRKSVRLLFLYLFGCSSSTSSSAVVSIISSMPRLCRLASNGDSSLFSELSVAPHSCSSHCWAVSTSRWSPTCACSAPWSTGTVLHAPSSVSMISRPGELWSSMVKQRRSRNVAAALGSVSSDQWLLPLFLSLISSPAHNNFPSFPWELMTLFFYPKIIKAWHIYISRHTHNIYIYARGGHKINFEGNIS